MRIFMLGWEFPPFISGGQAMACYGFAEVINQFSIKMTFSLPKIANDMYAKKQRKEYSNACNKNGSETHEYDRSKKKG